MQVTKKSPLKRHELNHTVGKLLHVLRVRKVSKQKTLIHTGIKPCACSSCDKSFRAKRSLTERERDHTANH